MKHIHLVTPYYSAAMRRMYEPLLSELAKIYKVTNSIEIDETADLNYHIPFHTLIGHERKTTKHVMAYTHCNAGSEAGLIDACERADLIICMSFKGRSELMDYGVDPEKVWVTYSAADQFAFRKRLIGIIGYVQPNARKRESLILDLAWQYDMTPFEFVFVGQGWEDLVNKLRALGVTASTHDAPNDDILKNFYREIDMLLVTGYREGGPLPLLEAMASGVDVLSPHFGYAADLLDEAQLYDSLEDLADKLEAYAAPYVRNHKLARAWRWQDYCKEHALIIGRLLGDTVDLYPEYGESRYAQLLDIIDEKKPAFICEIGTWNGNRALQMIQQAAKYRSIQDVYYHGFDLFASQTGEQFRRELSKVGHDVEVVRKRLEATGAHIVLIEGDTRETTRRNVTSSDFYFVDGGHSEPTVENDGNAVLQMMPIDAVAVFDDYYHEGKPMGAGCNKFIDALDLSKYEVTHLPIQTRAADGRLIGMVKVRKVKHANVSVQMSEQSRDGIVTPDCGTISYTVLPAVWYKDAQSPASV